MSIRLSSICYKQIRTTKFSRLRIKFVRGKGEEDYNE